MYGFLLYIYRDPVVPFNEATPAFSCGMCVYGAEGGGGGEGRKGG